VNVPTRMLTSVFQPSSVLDQHPEPSLSESILSTAAGRFYNAKSSLSPVTPNHPLQGANLVLIPLLVLGETGITQREGGYWAYHPESGRKGADAAAIHDTVIQF
jgi:hypothetical protein